MWRRHEVSPHPCMLRWLRYSRRSLHPLRVRLFLPALCAGPWFWPLLLPPSASISWCLALLRVSSQPSDVQRCLASHLCCSLELTLLIPFFPCQRHSEFVSRHCLAPAAVLSLSPGLHTQVPHSFCGSPGRPGLFLSDTFLPLPQNS